MTVHQAIRLARAAAAAAGRERGDLAPLPRKTRIIPTRRVRPHRDSNSGYRRERAVSWASRRWGLFRAAPDTMPAAERPARRLALAGEPGRLVLLAEHPGAEHAQRVAEQHRYGHQRQVERVAGGRDHRGDDHVQDDGVAAVLGEELVVDDP